MPPRKHPHDHPATRPYSVHSVGRRRRSRRVIVVLAGAAIAAAAAVGAVATSSHHSTQEDARKPGSRPSSLPAAPGPGRSASVPGTRPARVGLESLRVGSGVRGAEILRPAGDRPVPGVIFLHGWGLVSRSDYRPWIRHLARAGNEVIIPRYQRNEDSDPGRALADALAGIRASLRRAPIAPGTLVVAGHSAGAALAADYAASATARGLPVPLAVFAVYPGRRILGYPLGIPEVDPGRISRSTHIVAMAGASDVVVGQAPAQELVTSARRVPASRKRYLLVRDASVAGHYGPTRKTAAARRIFWNRLDRLIARARPDS